MTVRCAAGLLGFTILQSWSLALAALDFNTYDCSQGLLNWQTEWDEPKKAWCCEKRSVGCPTITQPPPGTDTEDEGSDFDCDVEFAQWRTAWSPTKQEYCCAEYNRGCPSPSAPAAPIMLTTTTKKPAQETIVRAGGVVYNCQEGIQDVQRLWDIEKQAHCCSQWGLGCPDNAFDCDSGYINWVHGWSEGKKIWCCARTNRGCPPTTITATSTMTTTITTTVPACGRKCKLDDVDVSCAERIHYASVHIFLGLASACQAAHQQVQRECGNHCSFCSVTEACFGAANVVTTTPPPTPGPTTSTQAPHFDCHEGLERWTYTWFPAKQVWCCQHMKLGCYTSAPPTTTLPPTQPPTTPATTKQTTPAPSPASPNPPPLPAVEDEDDHETVISDADDSDDEHGTIDTLIHDAEQEYSLGRKMEAAGVNWSTVAWAVALAACAAAVTALRVLRHGERSEPDATAETALL